MDATNMYNVPQVYHFLQMSSWQKIACAWPRAVKKLTLLSAITACTAMLLEINKAHAVDYFTVICPYYANKTEYEEAFAKAREKGEYLSLECVGSHQWYVGSQYKTRTIRAHCKDPNTGKQYPPYHIPVSDRNKATTCTYVTFKFDPDNYAGRNCTAGWNKDTVTVTATCNPSYTLPKNPAALQVGPGW